jgi:methionyl-tRNA formyltransferase
MAASSADYRKGQDGMKIEFLTTDDPLYILPFFEEFITRYAAEFEIIGVWGCRTMGKRPRGQLIRELLSLYGPIGFARLASRMAWYRAASVQRKDTGATRYYSLQQLCAAYGIPFNRVDSTPNSPEFISGLRERQADVLVSVACPFILKSEVLSVPHKGCINIHHAPLPRYKGMMPTFWQMYHGEKRVGVTVHYMVPKVDQGAALLQDSLEIVPGETLDQLIRRSKRHGAHCMARVLKQVDSGSQEAFPTMNEEEGSYFTFPAAHEIREFHKKGLRAI